MKNDGSLTTKDNTVSFCTSPNSGSFLAAVPAIGFRLLLCLVVWVY